MKEIENMDTKIEDLIDSLDLTQEIWNEIKLRNQNKIKTDEERNVWEWKKHLDYLMNIYNQGSTYQVVIRGSWQSFGFSRLNTLLLWAFSRQDNNALIMLNLNK